MPAEPYEDEEDAPEVEFKPRRGRPPRSAEVLGERRRRKNTGNVPGLKLGIDETALGMDRDKFAYRFINDKPGRVQNLTVNDDWDLVDDASKVASPTNADEGTHVSFHAGLGDYGRPMRTVLVRKPKQWYEDDQREKQKPLDDIDRDLRRGTAHKNAPEAAAIAGEHGYVPDGYISIRDGRRK